MLKERLDMALKDTNIQHKLFITPFISCKVRQEYVYACRLFFAILGASNVHFLFKQNMSAAFANVCNYICEADAQGINTTIPITICVHTQTSTTRPIVKLLMCLLGKVTICTT
jgi:hypothetical protein